MMKKFVLFSGMVFLSGSVYLLNPYKSNPFPNEREFELVYKASSSELPQEAANIRIWIPLASSIEGQTILERKIESPVAYQVTRDPENGNEMAYIKLDRPFPPSLDFNVIYQAKMTKPSSNQTQEGSNLSAYLKSSRLMVVNDTVRTRALDVVRGRNTLIEKAKGIYEDVIGRMRYDKTVPGWGKGDTVRACLLGKGNCTDFHSLFISMAHAAEIPARFKIGLTVPETLEGEIAGYHCWAEFYEEGKGWRPVDASEAWKHPERKETYFGNFDTNKFLISVGRDVELVPKQSGAPVNIFFYPYVEVDGKEWNGVKTEFKFKNRNN